MFNHNHIRLTALVFCLMLLPFRSNAEDGVLKVGYSDWPGWVAWDVAIDKGWIEEKKLNIEFKYMDYVRSLDAYMAGDLDAVHMTSLDKLLVASFSKDTHDKIIIIGDYSNGNDQVVAASGIGNVADLRGKVVGVEKGYVGHMLLLHSLENANMDESDITIRHVITSEVSRVLASGQVDAVAAWQPHIGKAHADTPGAKVLYTSADSPGLIYDLLVVRKNDLGMNAARWHALVDIWYRVVDYILDPATRGDAARIMGARFRMTAEEYMPLLDGTKFLTRQEALKAFEIRDGLDTLYGSSHISDDFNIKMGLYPESISIEDYFEPSYTRSE